MVLGLSWSEWTVPIAGDIGSGSSTRAGLEGWRFHDLCHFFVTCLFPGGAPAPARRSYVRIVSGAPLDLAESDEMIC
jgi:hypothetical protein